MEESLFKSIKVLIVEDDPECARNLHRYTETLGFTVKTVGSLRTAMGEAADADILILDTKVNGGQVSTETLMETWTASGLGPLCIVAGDEINRNSLIQSGACNVLQKPIQMATYSAIMSFYAKYILRGKKVEELTQEIKELKGKIAEDVKRQSRKIWIVAGISIVAILISGAEGLPKVIEFLQGVL